MLIKSLKLNNIRSYESELIEFPEGSSLLAGDIGAGKSTILLAIEFALFGVRRKHLSGTSLLRHGRSKGEVELNLEIEDKDVIIKRLLKRGKDDIKQEAGYIVIDGIKTEGTHIELKSKMLTLLGYPQDLLSKSKDLVFRYTVYTPQEAMKEIILEDKETRLNTLRRVFNIDKYKRIRENSQIFLSHIRDQTKVFEGNIADLPEKEKLLKEKQDELGQAERILKDIIPKASALNLTIETNTQSLKNQEVEIIKLQELKKEEALQQLSLEQKLEQRKTNTVELDILDKDIKASKAEILTATTSPDSLQKNLQENEALLASKHQLLLHITKKMSESGLIKRQAETTKEKITQLQECPVCLQQVNETHKHAIQQDQEKIIVKVQAEAAAHLQQEADVKETILKLQADMELVRKQLADQQTFLLQTKNVQEKEKRLQELLQQQQAIKLDIGKINVEKMKVQAAQAEITASEDTFNTLKKDLDLLHQQYQTLIVQQTEADVKKNEIAKTTLILQEDITKKQQQRASLTKLKNHEQWIRKHFLNLMVTMEKHVFHSVYHEFNDLFQAWFNILMEDETLTVRLDDEFTPIIEQNGYESFVENLSGGEKTAVALAYRLALNKVINDVISVIKTKDLIILDEPTDGFSVDQLDKMRLVLDELNMKQVIIVSHESKIESFVDNVIRVNKSEHVSEIV